MAFSEEPDRDPEWLDRVRHGLVSWYERGHRDLPWRREGDPYRILVSETMLVQTTVAAVVPYYERFLRQFPTAQALADASETDVLKAWEGLGYYRRARQLHAAAKAIVRDHGGLIPADLDAVRALPGVGRYIAGAVLSFAFDQPAAIVEANTQRVLSRLLAWPEELRKSSSQKRLWQAAERLVPALGAGTFNQALMELGATVCSPRAPLCLVCPISADCRARQHGLQDTLPIPSPKTPALEVVEACALVVRDGRFLVLKRGPDRLWAGFWEFPTIHLSGADPAGRSFGEPVGLPEGVRRLTGVEAEVGLPIKTVKFGVTKHRVTLSAHQSAYLSGYEIPHTGFVEARFATPAELAAFAMGSAVRKLATWAVEQLEVE